MGSKTWVLLNSDRVVNEIFTKRAGLTHERPYYPIASGLVSNDKRLFVQRTKDWIKGRRLVHQVMNGAASVNQGTIAETESVKLLGAYLDHPELWYKHHYRYTASIMHQIILSEPLVRSTEELDTLQKVTSSFLGSINSTMVDFFPQLTLLPRFLQWWRPQWAAVGQWHLDTFILWWKIIKSRVTSTDAPPSFVRDNILSPKNYEGDDRDAMFLTTSIMAAGSDNPRMTINAFVMACISAPEAMQKAREEADRVCGGSAERLPSLADMASMPYTCAVVKEVLRWRPTVPLIPQHQLVEDLDFMGYHFPAGTDFLVNSVPVCTNGYDTPLEFQPERWLEGGGSRNGIAQDLWAFAFGGGRRVCVGYKLAQKELFVAYARLLYCFEYFPVSVPLRQMIILK